jgi:hypothetical protein
MNNSKTNMAEERLYPCRILGTGAADPTKEAGPGLTVTRSAEGVLKVAFAQNPGTFVGIRGYAFGAATPSAVKGHTMTRDTYTAPASGVGGYIEISVWDSTFAADDLEATEYLDVTFAFAEQSVIE